jgi:putative PIG3 family NAD(P)H quinone oxidoreductase
MRAVEIARPGDPEVLRVVRRPIPQPGAGEVLIRVEAAGVNRPDALQRRGLYSPPPGTSDIPGLEVAGEVVACGADVVVWRAGDRVTALLAGGGYAEYAVAPAPQCLPIPRGFDAPAAAALPETFFTVWTNVFERGGLAAGEVFLVHGGASGIGTTAIAMAGAFGARVFATAGSPERCRACEKLGAERGIDRNTEDFVALTRELTNGGGVDVILDMVGGDYLPRNLATLAEGGRLVQIAYLRGAKVQIDLEIVMRRRLTITGSTLRPRSVGEKGAIAAALRQKVWPLLDAGELRPLIHATFPFAQAAAAHALLEANEVVGKIVLLP